VILERELNAKVKARRGDPDKMISKGAPGVKRLVDQYSKGDSRARRDLILLCDKIGIPLTNCKALEGALEDALSAEDEALLADFVRRHVVNIPRLPMPTSAFRPKRKTFSVRQPTIRNC
jgi:hypothetical protein